MHTASSEWAAQVADRNEIETAKARFMQTELDLGARRDEAEPQTESEVK